MGALPSVWSLVCLLHLLAMEACEAFSSRHGNVVFLPASVVPVGSNISVICTLTSDPCYGRGVFKYDKDGDDNIRDPDWANQTACGVQLPDVRRRTEVVCYLWCPGQSWIVHMAELHVGYPPDRPANITCRMEEFSSDMKCAWDTGQKTILNTSYDVTVTNLQTKHQNVETLKENFTVISVNRTRDERFHIQITARNALNYSVSDLLQIHLSDIVVPVTPVIREIRVLQSAFHVLLNWRNRTSGTPSYCELEYRTRGGSSWITVGEQSNKNNSLEVSVIQTADSLHLRCREETGKSYWSNWSPAHPIPPSAPMAKPDVWRILGQNYPNGTQEVTILIAPDRDEMLQRSIIGYRVLSPDKVTRRTCALSEVECKMSIPNTTRTLLVSAYNSYGSSPASAVTIQEGAVPQPRNLTITRSLQNQMWVQWQIPGPVGPPLESLLLLWKPDSCDGKSPTQQWKRLGKEEKGFIINGTDLAGRRVTIWLYAVSGAGVSLPSMLSGYTTERKPKKGPEFINTKKSSSKGREVRWSEVAECQQGGVVTQYTVYVTGQPNGPQRRYNTTVRQFTLDWNPDSAVSICVSAWTSAGEGPRDRCTHLEPDKSFENYFGFMLGMCLGGVTLTTSILALLVIRKRIKSAIMLRLPKYLQERYPKVEKSSAAKSLKEKIADPESHFNILYSDPEITDDLELLQQDMTQYATDLERTAEDFPPLLTPSAEDDMVEPSAGYRPQAQQPTSHWQDAYVGPSQVFDFPFGALTLKNPTVNPNMDTRTEINPTVNPNMDTRTEINPTVIPSTRTEMDPTMIQGMDTRTEINLSFFEKMNQLVIDADPEEDSTTGLFDVPEIGGLLGGQQSCHFSGELGDSKSYFPQVFGT